MPRGKSAHLLIEQDQVSLQSQSQSDGLSLASIQIQAQGLHHPFNPDLMTLDSCSSLYLCSTGPLSATGRQFFYDGRGRCISPNKRGSRSFWPIAARFVRGDALLTTIIGSPVPARSASPHPGL